jgi:hypothetical protein
LRAAAAQSARLHFAPGTRTEYSSTNYVLAGLVLLAHSPQAEGDWRRLELLELAIPPARRAAYAHMRFVNAAPICSVATLAGASSFIPGSLTPIWAQSGAILGWTCGNLAASPIDVATFYRDLLVCLPYTPPISPLYLPYLSPISPRSRARCSAPPLFLPYISPISPLYLPYISQVEGALLRPSSLATMQQLHLLDYGWDKV